MSTRKINAVFKKQIKDFIKNKKVIFLFLLMPIFAFFMNMIYKENMYPIMFLVMHISMVPIMTTAIIIAEEKENNTLQVLIMSNVKPMEYILGVGLFVFILSFLSSLLFLIFLSVPAGGLVNFIIGVSLGIICSTLLGAMIGIIADTAANVSMYSTPLTLLFSIVPLFASYNPVLSYISTGLYSGQIMTMILNLSEPISIIRIGIIIINALLFLVLFSIIYRKKKLIK